MNARRQHACEQSAAEEIMQRAWKAANADVIVFQNPGLIDLAAVTTMGVSVKDSETPIGYFGTGLKFSIATILRNGGTVELWRGTDRHVFGVQSDTVRGEAFDFVTLDDQRLGFTTQLGRNWEPWMAFRELASNCRDEGGFYAKDDWSPAEGQTTFVVGGRTINDVWPDRDTILLESEPLFANEHIEVHPGFGAFIYYRGVRIHQPNRPTALRYNIRKTIKLSEDREAANQWEVHYAIERGLAEMNDAILLRKALTCGDNYLEHHLSIGEYGMPGEVFRGLASELAMGGETCTRANPHVVSKAREWALERMTPGQSVPLAPYQQRMMEKATSMLARAGFDVTAFPLIVADTLGPNVHGAAKDGKIFLSRLPFQKGTRELAATLLEEYAHLRSGASDCTREFQNWLFDQVLVQIEHQAGEPF